MTRKRRPDPFKHKTFSLSEEVIEKIEELAKFEGITKSQLIELFVKNWDTGINPTEHLIQLQKEREVLQEKISEVDKRISEKTKQINLFNKWAKQKIEKKQQAIQILERKILNKEFGEAERMSKIWQRLTGISAIELLIEAKKNIERKGI